MALKCTYKFTIYCIVHSDGSVFSSCDDVFSFVGKDATQHHVLTLICVDAANFFKLDIFDPPSSISLLFEADFFKGKVDSTLARYWPLIFFMSVTSDTRYMKIVVRLPIRRRSVPLILGNLTIFRPVRLLITFESILEIVNAIACRPLMPFRRVVGLVNFPSCRTESIVIVLSIVTCQFVNVRNV